MMHDKMYIKENDIMNSRYEKLRCKITSELFGGIDPGEIISTSDTGDKHLSDCVRKLDTSRGVVLYYKPRDCRCSELLGDINELLFGLCMTPEQVCGDGYAFQKAVDRKLPADAPEYGSFYTLMGKLAAVFYALGSTDMHAENVIPSGAVPFVIDTETLLCPVVKGFSGAGDFSRDYGEIFPELGMSVGESMVLPRFYGKRQKSPLILSDSLISDDSVEAFGHGFAEGYRAVVAHSGDIGAVLDRYADIPVRFLTRSTQSYYRLIALYENAHNDEERETVLKRLEKGLKPEELLKWKGIVECERESIKNGDIPYFSIRAGETCLRSGLSGDVAVKGFAAVSPVENAKKRIARMTGKDLAVQCSYIHAAMLHTDAWVSVPTTNNTTDIRPLTADEALSEAIQAIHCLDEEKITTEGGRILWHAPLVAGIMPSLYGLAEGFSGIAYFCYAMSVSPIVPDDEKRLASELVEGCFADMKAFGEYLTNHYKTPAAEHEIYRRFEGGFGFTDGLAGFMWVLGNFREMDPETVDRILQGFESWDIPDTFSGEMQRFLSTDADKPCCNDTLFDGEARRAAVYLARYDSKDEQALVKAGEILADIRKHRLQNDAYTLSAGNRRQYFLPAFLRGSTGIAHIMLRYAELLDGYNSGGQEWKRKK